MGNKKSLLLLFLLGLLTSASSAKAKTLFAPQTCLPDQLTFLAKNLSKEPQIFWLQIHQGTAVKELRFELTEKDALSLSGQDFLKPGQSFFVKHPSSDQDLVFQLKCDGDWKWNEVASPVLDFQLSGQNLSLQLLIQNLDPLQNREVHLRWKDAEGFPLGEEIKDLGSPYRSSNFFLQAPAGARRLSLEGSGRFSARLKDLDHQSAIDGELGDPANVKIQEGVAYFLLSDATGTESFVVPLTDAHLLSQAREIVSKQQQKILLADIESSENLSENRNFKSEDRAPWSWRIRKVLGFADLANIECSGSPSLVEERLGLWMKRNPPRICFWSYFLKRELSAEEVESGVLKEP